MNLQEQIEIFERALKELHKMTGLIYDEWHSDLSPRLISIINESEEFKNKLQQDSTNGLL
jgi:hypothetical protein